MANPETIERAFFQVEGSSEKVEVHFNPESLQYTITNNLENQGSGNSTKQYVSDSTGKLTLDLVFDSTGSGEDVRLKTVKIAKFMEPSGSGTNKAPPIVNFEWGLYKFKGMVETYKETIDYFSANGVPLRASINISMSSQDKVFEGGSKARNAGTSDSAGQPNNSVPANPVQGKGITDIATRAGDPGAAKGIAASNGVESMRFPGDSAVELDASVALKGPSGFVSVGGGLDPGIGANLGLSAGISVGSNMSAGVSAGAGAFSGLHSSTGSRAAATLNLAKFIDADVSGSFGIDSASIGIGGSAGLQGSASLKAEVGTAGQLKSKIEFDGG
jgi:hypothetical protein